MVWEWIGERSCVLSVTYDLLVSGHYHNAFMKFLMKSLTRVLKVGMRIREDHLQKAVDF